MKEVFLQRPLLVLSLFVLGCGDGADAAEAASAGSDEAVYDEGAGLGEGACAAVCGAPDCGTCPSSVAMIDGGGFQIDVTEVDNAQYSRFLEVDFDASVLPNGCDWKSSFEPEGWAEDLDSALPVVGVDWCDAAVFCAWAGKQLCGAIGGGPVAWDKGDDPDNAWYHACSNGGANEYPYGPSYDPSVCNGDESGNAGLVPVASLAGCVGGVSGLFDMSGNVWEWTDACEFEGGDAHTQCRRRGGSRHSDAPNLRCAVNSGRARGVRDNGLGFRCCST